MSGGSRSSGTQRVVQTTELPDWQEEHLRRIASDAGRTYRSGGGFAPYPGSTHVPMTGDQTSAMDWTRSLLGNNPFLAPTFEAWGDIQSGQGMLGDQRDALSGAHDALGGFADVFRGARGITGFGDLYSDLDRKGIAGQEGRKGLLGDISRNGVAGQQGLESWLRDARGPLASETHLEGIARGDNLDGSNPYLDDIIGQSTARAQDATSSLFSGAGRYGGGAHQGVAARQAGEIATDFLGREYDMERQRQLAAAGQIDQATLGRRGQELAGLGQQSETDLARRGLERGLLGDMTNADISRYGLLGDFLTGDLDRYDTMLAAARGGADTSLALGSQYGNARDAMMANMQLAPLLREMQFSDPERLMRLGTIQQGELQAELQSMIDRWRQEQAMPLRELEFYQNIVNGLPDASSQTQNTSGTTPTGSPIAGALGGAATGAGLASSLGSAGLLGAGAMGGPVGWGLMGGGALLGLLG